MEAILMILQHMALLKTWNFPDVYDESWRLTINLERKNYYQWHENIKEQKRLDYNLFI